MVHHCSVTNQPIVADDITRQLQNPEHGAHITFFGVVRAHNLGRVVHSIDYDAFASLATKTFEAFCTEAEDQFGERLQIVIVHRVGKLKIGDISVAIAVASCHRDEAYRASRYIIEELKKRAPIWKKEYYADGESEWVRGHALCGHH